MLVDRVATEGRTWTFANILCCADPADLPRAGPALSGFRCKTIQVNLAAYANAELRTGAASYWSFGQDYVCPRIGSTKQTAPGAYKLVTRMTDEILQARFCVDSRYSRIAILLLRTRSFRRR